MDWAELTTSPATEGAIFHAPTVYQPLRHPKALAARDMIESTCYIHEGRHVGKPFRFLPFQLPILEGLADPDIHTIIISMGRKNGKTSVMGAIIPAIMLGPLMLPNSHIVAGAMSRKQASIVFRAAAQTIRMSSALKDQFTIRDSAKEILCPQTGVQFAALSADATTAYGESPRIIIMDELGQVHGPTYALYDALVTAQGAYEDGKTVIISTRPPEDGDLMNLLIDSAKTDPGVMAIVYAADDECDIMDEGQWYRANPALGVFRSYKDVQRQAEKAARLPSFEAKFRNLILNQKVDPNAPFISPTLWRSALVDRDDFPTFDELDELPLYIALDLSKKRDLTAMACVWYETVTEEDEGKEDEGFRLYLKMFFYLPGEGLDERSEEEKVPYNIWSDEGWLNTGSDRVVDYGYVAADVANKLHDRFEILKVGFDRWRWDEFQKELELQDVDLDEDNFRPVGQGFKDMSPCIDAFEEVIFDNNIVIENNPILNMCVSNAVITEDHTMGRRWAKNKAVRRIDGAVAASMAVRIALEDQLGLQVEGGSLYNAEEGLLILP